MILDTKIEKLYLHARLLQNVDFVETYEYDEFNRRPKFNISFRKMLEHLDKFVDLSDPDMSLPNSHHIFQIAEKARNDNKPDWFIMTCILHDLGKIMYIYGNKENGTTLDTQWAIVGDTFISWRTYSGYYRFIDQFNRFSNDERYEI